MSVSVSAVVPLVSVLIGAALTYWLNVRQRRRSYVDDVFSEAIAAVAVAAGASSYQPGIGKPVTFNDDEYRDLLMWHERTVLETYLRRTAEAREAVARAAAYAPTLSPYYEQASAVGERSKEVIAAVRKVQSEHRGRTRILRRRRAIGNG